MERLGKYVEDVIKTLRKSTPSVGEISDRLPIQEDPSEDLDFFLAPGKIEQLVSEGRTPSEIGRGKAKNQGVELYYQVPPRNFDPAGIDSISMSAGGCYQFFYKDGTRRAGSTYTLNEEQSQHVEERISAETERLTIK